MIVYEGPSQLDGKPIVAIATEHSKNKKTGAMVQLWIMRSDVPPMEARKTGEDFSICGDCKLKEGACYVNIFQAPTSVYKTYKKGGYKPTKPARVVRNRTIRIGALGDTSALPRLITQELTLYSKGYTNYTHQWDKPKFQWLKEYAVASVDNLEEYHKAKKLGWNTFRIFKDRNLQPNEMICPAKPDKYTCLDCLKCSGVYDLDIAAEVHGADWKIMKFNGE